MTLGLPTGRVAVALGCDKGLTLLAAAALAAAAAFAFSRQAGFPHIKNGLKVIKFVLWGTNCAPNRFIKINRTMYKISNRCTNYWA